MIHRLAALLATVLLLAGGATAHAQGRAPQRDPMAEPHFAQAGGTNDIFDDIVTSLAQDERGFIWVGTASDLVRYDGHQVKAYPLEVGEGKGLRTARFMRPLLAAPGAMLWSGSDAEGVARFDSHKESWVHFHSEPADPGSIAPGAAQSLALDKDGSIWIALLGSLDRYDVASGKFEHHRVADGIGLVDDRFSAVLVTRNGDLWAGSWSGLAVRRAGQQTFQALERSLFDSAIDALVEAPDGSIWIGMRNGKVLRTLADGSAVSVLPPSATAQPAPVQSFCVMDDEVWVGRVNGIEIRALDGRLLHTVARSRNRPWTLSGTNFRSLLRDSAGMLWVGSYGGGLKQYLPSNRGMWVRRHEDDPANPLAESDVHSIVQLRNGEIWLGTLDRGIAVLDSALRYAGTIPIHGDFAGQVVGMAQLPDGSIWTGNDAGKIFRFDEKRQLRETLTAQRSRVRRLLGASDGTLWVATTNGVYKLAPQSHTLEGLALSDGKPLAGNINALVEDKQGRVWVGAEIGLYEVTPKGLVAVTAASGLPPINILGLLADRHGGLWADTNAGLYRSTTDGKFEQTGTLRGPAAHSTGANLLDDAQGRIWTHRGVYDPKTNTITEFSRADGADFGTGWFRSYAALADGRMLFGGANGVLVVEPERYQRWQFSPPVVVTELRVDNRLEPATRLQQEGLQLHPGQRTFSIEFAALDYSLPAQNRYRYRLQGYDSDWITTGADLRVASYGNLAPGSYTMEVQGTNRLGEWSSVTLKFPLTVLPAWWQTWWARTLGVLLAALAVYALLQWRTRSLQRSRALLEQRVRERTAELEAVSEALKESSLVDPLTGLHNRRYLIQHIEADVAILQRRHEAGKALDTSDLIFILIDIDHFKQVNDRHGHSAGDAVLIQMAARLRDVFRESDHVVRWGGEEFLVVVRDAARDKATEVVERMRLAVATQPFVLPDGQQIESTCSIGFACFPLAPKHLRALGWQAMVDVADGALYEAKRSGRNRWVGVVSADDALDAGHQAQLLSRPPVEWLADAQLEIARSETRRAA